MSLVEEQVVFVTDGVATAGTATEQQSGETSWYPPYDIVVEDLFQTLVVLANDADWQLYINGLPTRFTFTAEELDPASVGRHKWKIGITRGRQVQMRWSGQAAAQVNNLKVIYRRAR